MGSGSNGRRIVAALVVALGTGTATGARGPLVAVTTSGGVANLRPETVTAWNAYVPATEARMATELRSRRGFLTTDFASDAAQVRRTALSGGIPVSEKRTMDAHGAEIDVPGGLISHWRGSVFLPAVTLETLLNKLRNPSELGPHQEDVLAVRVLDRQPDALSLFIRMTRTKIVTVTYDTEHRVEFQRHTTTRASSRSVATRITEVDGAGTSHERPKPPGQDRGFLWRMNSYWRYEQVPGGVILELESLTLSRSIPFGLHALVRPLIRSIARESMTRTLGNLRAIHAG